MHISLLLTIAAVIAGAALFILYRRHELDRQANTDVVPRYELRKPMFNAQELGLYKVLKQIYAQRAFIFPKVRLSEVLQHPGYDQNIRNHWARVQRRSIDFLICDTELTPMLAIKLGATRKGPVDDVLEDALTAADLPLLRLRPAEEYQVEEVMNRIKFAIAGSKLNSGMYPSASMSGEGQDTFSDSRFPRIKRWTSDLWMSARSKRVH